MQEIYKKIDEAIASEKTSEETKVLLKEIKSELKRANTEKKVASILALLIKLITGLFDD